MKLDDFMKRTVWFIIGGILLVVLLGGAAYMGGKLLSGNKPSTGDGGGLSINMSGPGGKGGKTVQIKSTPAPELPQTRPDAAGIFDHIDNRSIFVKTGQSIMMMTSKDGQTASSADGPVVEVVVNQDTKIYKDTTKLPDSPSSSVAVQETVAEGSLDEIGQNSMVRAWGELTGERLVATVLVYSQPMIMNAKPAR